MAKNNKIHQDRDPRSLQTTIKKEQRTHTCVYHSKTAANKRKNIKSSQEKLNSVFKRLIIRPKIDFLTIKNGSQKSM